VIEHSFRKGGVQWFFFVSFRYYNSFYSFYSYTYCLFFLYTLAANAVHKHVVTVLFGLLIDNYLKFSIV